MSSPAPTFACPQCHTTVQTGDTICWGWGIDLALAAVLAERYALANVAEAAPPNVQA